MTVLASAVPVTLIGGAPFPRSDLDAALNIGRTVAAADGGADQALAHGLLPEAVFGDFDSLSAHAKAVIPAERLHRIAEQDSTDFEKSLSRIRAPLVVAVGFSGARQDHFLANLSAMARRVGPPCILIAGSDVITLCPPRIGMDLPAGTRVSLFPMGSASGISEGLKWPIDGLKFASDGRVGTSNEAMGPIDLAIDGPMLLILPGSCLGLLAAAI
ncbi:thiamine diphosphokinase [Paracoccus sp. MBLB3053]|uniref:Thiamine diphosphokinase n=1 Tax=Paracoccus aurantius TaxID=3073814 RepID=A0ABU2HQD1_9RHOB|nr:thiamine diphosphokinase [Paracoccus sp. MBLB3053]MDS9467246.1 thiamine diphosphokinase [Paracoccus sp. MBLB3053]